MILRYLVIFLCAALTFVNWFFLLTVPCFSRWFIAQHLELSALEGFDARSRSIEIMSGHVNKAFLECYKEVLHFVSDYLNRDGVLVLRMVSSHAGVIFGSDLVLALWNAFYKLEDKVSMGKYNMNVFKQTTVEYSPTSSDTSDSVRLRKKKLMLPNAEDFTTTLLPLSPEDDTRKSAASR